jgi:hypothetical protein
MNHKYILFLSVFLISTLTKAQNNCGVTVNAGNDITICEGASTQLNGSVSGGNNTTYIWSPATGLNDPNILNPIATPNATTTYTLTAMATSANLIINGDFETQSILPATTQYTQAPTPIAIGTNSPNYYAILDVPQIIQAFGCDPNIGQYTMVLHGSTGVNVNFWCQTINVEPNREYKIKYKVFGIPYFFVPAPVIVAKINGQSVGSVTAPNSSCGMAEGEFTWQSGGNNTAEICFANSAVASFGSMCAVDDIQFFECCVETDEVTVFVDAGSEQTFDELICNGDSFEFGGQQFNFPGIYTINLLNLNGCDSILHLNLDIVEVEADIQISNELNCINTEAVLSGSGSIGTFGIQIFEWNTSDGFFLSDPNESDVVIGGAGTYTLKVTSTNGTISCEDEIDIIVPIDTISPFFLINEPPQLTCEDTLITLSVYEDELPPFYTIIWTTQNGNFVSGVNSLSPQVNRPGIYALTIIDTQNGCIGYDLVEVFGGGELPIIQLDTLSSLNCRDSTGLVRVTVNKPLEDISILWTTANGEILEGEDALEMLFGQPGTYQLVVTDTTNGCSGRLIINPTADIEIPILQIPLPDTLDCQQSTITLEVLVGPTFDTLTYEWKSIDGIFAGRTDTSSVEVRKSGTYIVIVENPKSGCRDSISVDVIADDDLPVASAGEDLMLNCAQDTVFPNTSGTTTGSEIRYLWTKLNGTIEEDSLLSISISEPGTYILKVFNIANLCSVQDTIEVFENYNTPQVLSITAAELNCRENTITIESAFANEENSTILWTGPPGGIVSGLDSRMPSVGLSGWYFFTIRDTISQCEFGDSILVTENRIQPTILIELPDTLDCQLNTISLDASQSSGLGPLSYIWTTNTGNILSGDQSPMPIVNRSGFYYLTILDDANGCENMDSVFVEQNSELEQLTIQKPDTLNCIRNSITLLAEYSNPNSMIGMLWSTVDGNILSNPNSPEIQINAPGKYWILLTDSTSNCQLLDSIIVISDLEIPNIETLKPNELTCDRNSIEIFSQNNSPDHIVTYQWNTQNGNITSSSTILETIMVDRVGIYTLIVQSTRNGCMDTLNQMVFEDIEKPIANAGSDINLPCGEINLVLDGSNSSGTGNLEYRWTSSNGSFVTPTNLSTVGINSTGNYTLVVRQIENGCTDTAFVNVVQLADGKIDFIMESPLCIDGLGHITIIPSLTFPGPLMVKISGDQSSYSENERISLQSGSRLITITDSRGCQIDTLVTIPMGQALEVEHVKFIRMNRSSNLPFTFNFSFSESSISTIEWNPAGIFIPGSSFANWTITNPIAGEYQFTITTNEGCEFIGLVKIELTEDLQGEIFVPNAFSPYNKDGLNDIFYPFSASDNPIIINQFLIFNRWGNQVFQAFNFPTNEPEFGWDGSFQNIELNPSTFVWWLEYVSSDGTVKILKGEILLY